MLQKNCLIAFKFCYTLNIYVPERRLFVHLIQKKKNIIYYDAIVSKGEKLYCERIPDV